MKVLLRSVINSSGKVAAPQRLEMIKLVNFNFVGLSFPLKIRDFFELCSILIINMIKYCISSAIKDIVATKPSHKKRQVSLCSKNAFINFIFRICPVSVI